MRSAEAYERKQGSRVWSARVRGNLLLDGEQVEKELLAFLKKASDVTTTSQELALGIDDWSARRT
jgi:hypothetical protein